MRIAFLASLCGLLSLAPLEAQRSPAEWVNPLGGTDSTIEFSRGNLYPAVSLPFGMNAWTPQTGENASGWTYQYHAFRLRGFKLTHQPSPWINDYGCISLMPMTGSLRLKDSERGAVFSHDREEAHPDHYRVKLLESGIWAEMTPTLRGAVMRFTYPATEKAYVVLDAFPAGKGSGPASVEVEAGRRRLRVVSRAHRGGVPANFAHHVLVEFDREILECGVWDQTEGPKPGTQLSSVHPGVWVRFAAAQGAVVQARIASSFISAEQAELNFQREVAGQDFEHILTQARRAWDACLGKLRVEGGTPAQKEIFYSCLYRASLFPRIFHELDAQGRTVHYSPYSGTVEPGPLFTDNGFWDTFRAAFPLMTLLHPRQDAQIMEGILSAYRESGWMPEWQSPGHRNCMIGTNSTALLADAWMKGLRGWDGALALEGIAKGAHAQGPMDSVGRLGSAFYDKLGYVPADAGIRESAARTLEYAYNDFCAWKLAKALGRPAEEVEAYGRRAFNYRHLYDASTGFMRGRNQDGSWQTPFRPDAWGGVFTEGCAWHWTWCVFHDPAGLAQLMGGDEAMVRKLDSVFTALPTNEYSYYGGMIHEIAEMVAADMGQYAHGNQPIQHMLYLYDWVGQPWKTQYWVRQVMDRMYHAGPGMYCGDEDNGQTSAWFVLSALGFYSVAPGTNQFALGSPLFDRATLRLENGKSLVIQALNQGPRNVYVQSVTLNGRALARNWIGYEELMQGGRLVFQMGANPNTRRGTRTQDRPYSLSLDPEAPRN